jgi:glycolate oxidase FAD binding subunit
MAVYKPDSEGELAELVAGIAEAGESLDIMGGRSLNRIGGLPRATHRVDLSGLTGIIAYEPDELVLTARAGTTLNEIEAALAEKRQHLAFEPPDFGPLLAGAVGQATIGGVLSSNRAGPRRLTAGAARDHLLGFRAIGGRGEVFKSGGRVVKNVTGYDLSKLVCGAWGTLAILTEVSVKVLPAPAASATLVIPGETPTRAVITMAEALSGPQAVSAAAWLPAALASGDDAVTLLRVEGSAGSVSARIAALQASLGGERDAIPDSGRLWQRIRDGLPLAEPMNRAIWRVSVAPSAGPAILEALPHAMGYLDWAGGLVWLALDEEGDTGAAKLRAAIAASGGGHATLWRGSDRLRAAIPVFEPASPGIAALSRRVKHAFDPLGLFNPGRLGSDADPVR